MWVNLLEPTGHLLWIKQGYVRVNLRTGLVLLIFFNVLYILSRYAKHNTHTNSLS